MLKIRMRFVLGLPAVAALTVTPAYAQDNTGFAGGLVAGALDPLQGPGYVWGASRRRPSLDALPMRLPAAMAFDAIGMAGRATACAGRGLLTLALAP